MTEVRTFESTALDLAKAMKSAIKRFETIQETHPDIILDADLAYYRHALFWFHKMPKATAREVFWSDGNA